MKEHVFNFSLNTIKERKQLVYIMMIFLSLMVLVLAYIYSNTGEELDTKMMIYIIAIVLPLINIIMFVTTKVLFKRLKKLYLVIGEDSLKKNYIKYTEELKFESIKSVIVKRDKFGNLEYLKLKAKSKNITVYGFEDIITIYNMLRKKVDKSKMTESQYRINWNSNFIIVLTMIITFCIILFVINLGFYDIFNMIFVLGLSIFYFIYKPLSKSFGLKHKKIDVTIAIVIFLSGLIMLIDFIKT